MKKGFGSKLIAAVLYELKEQGYDDVFLWVLVYEFIDMDSTISRIAEKSLLSTTGSCSFFEKVIG